MGLGSRFTTTISIFKLINIDKSRDMENPDLVTMSGPKRIYQDAQKGIFSDLAMTFSQKENVLLEYKHGEVIDHHCAKRSPNAYNPET